MNPSPVSRSRPFQKNDNRFVEENNFSLVCSYLGYQRLDTVAHTILLNQLYDQLWLYHNFFQPVMRLKHKFPTDQPLRSKRIYDQAQSPLNRTINYRPCKPPPILASCAVPSKP